MGVTCYAKRILVLLFLGRIPSLIFQTWTKSRSTSFAPAMINRRFLLAWVFAVIAVGIAANLIRGGNW